MVVQYRHRQGDEMKYLVVIAIMFTILSGCSNPAGYEDTDVPVEETQESAGGGIQQIINELIQEALEKAKQEAMQEVAKEVNQVITQKVDDIAQDALQEQIEQEVATSVIVKLPF